jgi:RNA-directed DNA polymerase
VKLPDETFDFLGYTVGRFYGGHGRPYWGTRPSKKAIKRPVGEIHDATTSRWNALDVQSRLERLNPLLRGWSGYFNQGPVKRIYERLDKYVARRLRIWLMRKRGKRGTGYRQYSDQYLYETLGLIRPQTLVANRANAKV